MQLPHITSIAVYDDSPSFAYTVVRIESSGRIAENLKLRRETKNNCHFAIGELQVSACHVKACLTADSPGMLWTNVVEK